MNEPAVTELNLNLSDLWKVARQYGQVNLFTQTNGLYNATIVFDTIDHTSLEARSDYTQETPEAALSMAIGSAKAIVDSLRKTLGDVKKEVTKIETTKGVEHAS